MKYIRMCVYIYMRMHIFLTKDSMRLQRSTTFNYHCQILCVYIHIYTYTHTPTTHAHTH